MNCDGLIIQKKLPVSLYQLLNNIFHLMRFVRVDFLSFPMKQEIMGSPIKGHPVKRKYSPNAKKFPFLQGDIPNASLSLSDSLSTPAFSLLFGSWSLLTSTSHPSGLKVSLRTHYQKIFGSIPCLICVHSSYGYQPTLL